MIGPLIQIRLCGRTELSRLFALPGVVLCSCACVHRVRSYFRVLLANFSRKSLTVRMCRCVPSSLSSCVFLCRSLSWSVASHIVSLYLYIYACLVRFRFACLLCVTSSQNDGLPPSSATQISAFAHNVRFCCASDFGFGVGLRCRALVLDASGRPSNGCGLQHALIAVSSRHLSYPPFVIEVVVAGRLLIRQHASDQVYHPMHLPCASKQFRSCAAR